MLKVRLIPTLLLKDVGLVKGIGFNSWRRVGTVMPAIKVYNTRQVDELIIVDITAFREGRLPDCDQIKDFSADCFVPLTIGGGIRSFDDIRNLLRAGADKVCINSITYEKPEFIKEAANKFGSQCIVVSIDVGKKNDGSYECFSYSGSKSTGKDPVTWAKEIESLGAGELLITSIERDGTMQGYDLELIKKITKSVNIPVIASGGCGNYNHMYEVISYSGASAVAAASIFHFTHQTPMEAKLFLSSKGMPVRNVNINKNIIEN